MCRRPGVRQWHDLDRPLIGPHRGREPSSDETSAGAVLAAVDTLPIDQAHALWLVDVFGCSYLQAAIETGADELATAQRVRSGRETVRSQVT